MTDNERLKADRDAAYDMLARVLEIYFPADQKQPPLICEARALVVGPKK